MVHIAPAFGEDDSNVGRHYGLPFVQLVDEKGEMTKETPWAGTFCKDADKPILEDLEKEDFFSTRRNSSTVIPTAGDAARR